MDGKLEELLTTVVNNWCCDTEVDPWGTPRSGLRHSRDIGLEPDKEKDNCLCIFLLTTSGFAHSFAPRGNF